MSYLDLAKALVERLEACKLVGYPDSTGRPTNGYGHTGPEVRIGVTITQEIADHNLEVDLGIADQRLLERCPGLGAPGHNVTVQLDDHERAALISFVFNVGAGETWQIWKDINAGNLADVPHQLRRFVNGKIEGKEQEIPGLENRREAEIVFWNTADVEAAAAVMAAAPIAPPPSAATRDMPTPPTPTPQPILAKPSLTTKIVTVVGGVTAAVGSNAQQIHDIVAPHASEAPIFQTVATVAIGAVIISSVVALFISHAQQEARKT